MAQRKYKSTSLLRFVQEPAQSFAVKIKRLWAVIQTFVKVLCKIDFPLITFLMQSVV